MWCRYLSQEQEVDEEGAGDHGHGAKQEHHHKVSGLPAETETYITGFWRKNKKNLDLLGRKPFKNLAVLWRKQNENSAI